MPGCVCVCVCVEYAAELELIYHVCIWVGEKGPAISYLGKGSVMPEKGTQA